MGVCAQLAYNACQVKAAITIRLDGQEWEEEAAKQQGRKEVREPRWEWGEERAQGRRVDVEKGARGELGAEGEPREDPQE